MELSFFLVHPLPTWRPRRIAVELEVSVLLVTFDSVFVSVSDASKVDDLLLAYVLDLKLHHLVHSSAYLTTVRDLVLPQMHAFELEVVFVSLLESIHSRLELILELEQYVLTEAFA